MFLKPIQQQKDKRKENIEENSIAFNNNETIKR